MTTARQFIDQIRHSPRFIEGARKDPIFVEHLDAIEYGIDRVNELANDNAVWLDRYDQVRALLGNESLTIKQRLFALCDLIRPWHAEWLKSRGH